MIPRLAVYLVPLGPLTRTPPPALVPRPTLIMQGEFSCVFMHLKRWLFTSSYQEVSMFIKVWGGTRGDVWDWCLSYLTAWNQFSVYCGFKRTRNFLWHAPTPSSPPLPLAPCITTHPYTPGEGYQNMRCHEIPCSEQWLWAPGYLEVPWFRLAILTRLAYLKA